MTNKIQLHLIKFFFQAFLPRETQQSLSYYEALDITSNANADKIRQAYRKKSLQYHPDKVAQRQRRQQREREKNANHDLSPHENQIEYNFVQIKEAYDALSDPRRRSAYDVLGVEGGKMYCSIVGGSNVSGSGGFEMNTLVYNLARASLFDKSKLFLIVLVAIMLMLLGPILICAKIDANATTTTRGWEANWVVVLTPVWVVNLLVVIHTVLGRTWFATLRMLCIFALEILLALKWDGIHLGDLEYEYILIPLYTHQALLLLEGIVLLWSTKKNIQRMVTVSYLERHVLPHFRLDDADNESHRVDEDANVTGTETGNIDHPASRGLSYENLTDDERETIDKLYIIVTETPKGQDPDNPFDVNNNDDDDDESLSSIEANLKFMYTVANSPEYQQAAKGRSQAIKRIISAIIFRIPFMVLLVLQLQVDVGNEMGWRWNWNIVFAPLWVEVLLYALSACFVACCAGGIVRKRGHVDDMDEMEIIEVELGDDNENENESAHNDNMIHQDVELGHESKTLLQHDNTRTVDKGTSSSKVENKYVSTSANEDNPAVQTSTSRGVDQDGNDDDDDDDSSDDGIEIDSQSAEKQAKALGGCCYYAMVVVALTLFLVKLNRATDIEKGLNYSSFWVIFPLFVVASLILCLFGCCIFATPEDMMREEEEANRNNDNPRDGVADGGDGRDCDEEQRESVINSGKEVTVQELDKSPWLGAIDSKLRLDDDGDAKEDEAMGASLQEQQNDNDAGNSCMEDLD